LLELVEVVEQEMALLLAVEAEEQEAQQMDLTQLLELVARVEQAILQQEMELMEFRLLALREILVQFMVAVVLEQKPQQVVVEHQELELMVIYD
jgi:hypothetical protein